MNVRDALWFVAIVEAIIIMTVYIVGMFQMRCTSHGELVYLKQGKIYCQSCGKEIPLSKLKKKEK